MAMTFSKNSGWWGPRLETVRSAQPTPAHWIEIRRSSPCSTAAPTAASTSSGLVTSACAKRAPSPSSAARASPFSALTSAMVTRAPSACRRRLVASPSPEAPPTTRAPAPSMRMAAEPSRFLRGGYPHLQTPGIRMGAAARRRESAFMHSKTFAARAGRWSAQHKRKAIFGWLAFVIAAVAIGTVVGTNRPVDDQGNTGEARRADRVVSDHFPKYATESVLIQARSGQDQRSPEVRTAVAGVMAAVRGQEGVQNIKSPYNRDNAGQISKDGRSVLVQFEVR